ncbi:hypothetical protein ACFLV0_06800 [Chloroflexota bacterium]
MDRLNVLIVSGTQLYEGYLNDIMSVDPCISAKDGTKEFFDEVQRKGESGQWVDILKDRGTIRQISQNSEGHEDLDTLLAQAEVVFGRMVFPDDLIARAPRLKWIHIQGAGIDAFSSTGIFNNNIDRDIVTNVHQRHPQILTN